MYKPQIHPEKSGFLLTVRNLHFKLAPKMIPLPVTIREPAGSPFSMWGTVDERGASG